MTKRQAAADIPAIIRDRRLIDQAFADAFADAVHRHRAEGVPMVLWENGAVVHVDPFEVRLPGEEDGGEHDTHLP